MPAKAKSVKSVKKTKAKPAAPARSRLPGPSTFASVRQLARRITAPSTTFAAKGAKCTVVTK